jgi:nucleoside-diphosphate-sugar epimerase
LADHPLVELNCIGINHAWWRKICSPDIIPVLAKWRSSADLDDIHGPAGSMIKTAKNATLALQALTQIETYQKQETYLQVIGALERHIANLNSAQTECDISLGFGAVATQLNYYSSLEIESFARAPSFLAATISMAMEAISKPPSVAGFLVTSPFDLATAAITATIIATRWPDCHRSLIDHGYENYSLEPHADALLASGALNRIFDSVVVSQDDIETLAPALIARATSGDPLKGFLPREVATLPESEKRIPTGSAPRFPIFSPAPVVYARTSSRRCYWSRCTFCTQNVKYDNLRAPSRLEVVKSVDHLSWLESQGISNIYLSDEAISPGALRAFCNEILQRKLAIRWACRCKFERSFSRELLALAAKAGCYEILFGLESISTALLARMGKPVEGLDSEGVRRIVRDMAELRIGVHINLINGFPGETLAEAEATRDFVIALLSDHPNATYRLNSFTLFPATPVLADPQSFGLERVWSTGDMPAAYSYTLDMDTQRRTDPVKTSYARLVKDIDNGLGWSALRRTAAGREAMNLYFGSGHSAIFKTLPTNPLDRRAMAVTARRATRRDKGVVGMRVLLTGASGNAGGAIKRALLEANCEITVLARNADGADPRCSLIRGDLDDLGDLQLQLAPMQAIIHCASPRSLDRSVVMRSEIEATARLLEAWRCGPFITFSSQTVYGVPQARLNEGSPTTASSWYDIGKLAIEAMLAMEAGRDARGVGVALRLPLLFGGGPRRNDRQYLPQLLNALRAGKTFLFESAEGMRDYGSVFIGEEDLGDAAIASLMLNRGGNFNLASGFVTWRELIDMLAHRLNLEPRYNFSSTLEARPDEFRLPQSRSDYDCSRFRRASGFTPRQTLSGILEAYIAAEAAVIDN